MKNKVDENPSNPRWDFQQLFHKKNINTTSRSVAIEKHGKNDILVSQEGKSFSISCWIYDTSFAE